MNRLAILVCLLASVVFAQDDLIFRTETRVVEVTIIATDRDGRPVADLTADEIEVRDNGKLQQIQTFLPIGSYGEAIRRESRAGEATDPTAPRHTVILLDALNTNFGDQAHVRSALVDVFRDFIADEDRIAVFVLSNRLKMLHDFTHDRAALETLAQAFSGEAAAGDVRAYSTDGESVDFTLQDIFAKPDRARSRAEAELLLQRRVLTTLDALSSIAKGTAHIPGQKNLIWLSSAFPLQSWSSRRNTAGGVSSIGPSQNFNREAERMTDAFNAANMNIYPVDARGLSTNPRAHINISVMRQFAEETGGKAYANNNDLTSGVRAALDDSRTGYVLTYAPNNYDEGRTRHTIKLRTTRSSIDLRYRPGYTAVDPDKSDQK